MIRKGFALLFFFILVISGQGCKDNWEEHYLPAEGVMHKTIWEAIQEEPRFSVFVEEIKKLSLDTIFNSGITHTLFIPENEALQQALDTSRSPEQLMLYHISPTLFMSRNVTQNQRLQTLLGKFALLSVEGNVSRYDDVTIIISSPLFRDGKYYEIESPSIPRLNLYEFTARYSPYLKNYIDSQDSSYLDFELSTPVGFDDYGNTVYDSVVGVVNLFEQKYFPISKEFRNKNATFVLFTQEQYESALDQVASDLQLPGGTSDAVPKEWQSKVLMPQLLTNAMFDGMLEYQEFMVGEMPSITGDIVNVDFLNINPDSKYLCSNGLTYTYNDFSIHDSLYLGATKIEGESLMDTVGSQKWIWKEDIVVSGLVAEPKKYVSNFASNNGILSVEFPRSYQGEYSMEFVIYNMLPMPYRLVWSSNSRPSGLFALYVNDEKIGEFDSYGFRSLILSVTGEPFRPKNGFNRKDFWVDNITEFGDVRVRFEYLGMGQNETNGLSIDYIELIPII